jgi:hypothetical protein
MIYIYNLCTSISSLGMYWYVLVTSLHMCIEYCFSRVDLFIQDYITHVQGVLVTGGQLAF